MKAESANEVKLRLAQEHQDGLDRMDGVIGERVPGLIAFHKFQAGWDACLNHFTRQITELEFFPWDDELTNNHSWCDGDETKALLIQRNLRIMELEAKLKAVEEDAWKYRELNE